MAIPNWSKEGVGFVVLQQYCLCISTVTPFYCRDGWHLALCGSRHFTKAEAGYAPVEGEALAVAWCLRKARLFLLGCPNLTLVTDHKPLVKLFGQNKELKDNLSVIFSSSLLQSWPSRKPKRLTLSKRRTCAPSTPTIMVLAIQLQHHAKSSYENLSSYRFQRNGFSPAVYMIIKPVARLH